MHKVLWKSLIPVPPSEVDRPEGASRVISSPQRDDAGREENERLAAGDSEEDRHDGDAKKGLPHLQRRESGPGRVLLQRRMVRNPGGRPVGGVHVLAAKRMPHLPRGRVRGSRCGSGLIRFAGKRQKPMGTRGRRLGPHPRRTYAPAAGRGVFVFPREVSPRGGRARLGSGR